MIWGKSWDKDVKHWIYYAECRGCGTRDKDKYHSKGYCRKCYKKYLYRINNKLDTDLCLDLKQSPEHRAKMSEIMLEKWRDDEFRDKHIRIMLDKWADQDSIYNTQGYKNRMMESIRAIWRDENSIYNTDEYISKMRKILNNPEYRKKRSDISKDNWQDPEYRERNLQGRSNPNSPLTDIELELRNILLSIPEIDYKEVFERFYIPGSLLGPVDFYLIQGNLIVEADGEYWHKSTVQQLRDRDKEISLKYKGYRFLRFEGEIIKQSPDKVRNAVLKILF